MYLKQRSDRTIFDFLNVFDSESKSQELTDQCYFRFRDVIYVMNTCTLQKCCNSQKLKELKPLSRLYANPCSSPCRNPAWEAERRGTSVKFLLFDILCKGVQSGFCVKKSYLSPG